MWNVSGITGAAPVWVEIMNRLHHDQTSSAPALPPGVVAGALPGGKGRREWFLRGTEAAVVAGLARAGSRITYPAPETVIALDPDIPAEDQKVFFEANPVDDRLHWALDGESIGSAGTLVLWTPKSGKHTLALVDSSGHALDSITFEVRGNLISALVAAV